MNYKCEIHYCNHSSNIINRLRILRLSFVRRRMSRTYTLVLRTHDTSALAVSFVSCASGTSVHRGVGRHLTGAQLVDLADVNRC